ncbi:NAD(P)H-quinone oxidoreductase [Xylanibacillus composti]|uniref:NAD(P)H quinone oxidoreductase n=1 Tax=Xylanibacillus composti TaxID=1572762 RepID=A0A8J4H4W8_9BACL|nr:NAD(P)H-quinone oxidoreductase [Xylanibacillus composti]MDT9723684.1 NAD(P)H-quinone oxidoreductase [Xylanibacillus composti]GIQ71023.1 NAD(P)H quinone oxidoreductase [Xylanibacillus composti]
MRAVLVKEKGGPEQLYLGETLTPQPSPGELLVRVKATALNRADLLQRRGLYPPPQGASPILGLEMAGEVVETGEHASKWQVGDRVCALLPGGGYAEYVTIPEGMAMPIPPAFSYEEAAAIPEVWLTAYLNLYWLGGLGRGCRVLVHAGASGVGTAAIQLIREAGGLCWVTAGSERKLERCRELGAEDGWNYRNGSFAPWLAEQVPEGVHIVMDFIGASYLQDNLEALAVDGRLILIGTMGGGIYEGPLNLGHMLMKRLQVLGTNLRMRDTAEKIRLSQEFSDYAMPLFEKGTLKPVIDRVYDWREAAEAHRYMERNENIGKIILQVDKPNEL